MKPYPRQQLIWASPRELLNIFHADSVGCHVITVTNDILKKLDLVGKDLGEYSLETVKMFYDDAREAASACRGTSAWRLRPTGRLRPRPPRLDRIGGVASIPNRRFGEWCNGSTAVSEFYFISLIPLFNTEKAASTMRYMRTRP